MHVRAVQDLKDSVKKLLLLFHQRSKHKPERIIFMRDGVSEGQFPQVQAPSNPGPITLVLDASMELPATGKITVDEPHLCCHKNCG